MGVGSGLGHPYCSWPKIGQLPRATDGLLEAALEALHVQVNSLNSGRGHLALTAPWRYAGVLGVLLYP